MILNIQNINMDAWSDGQMKSKLWLCQELEKNWTHFENSINKQGAKVWIYGSWYGTLAQFLLIRERIRINKFELYDLDLNAIKISKEMTMMWWLNNQVDFEFHHQDCGDLSTNHILENKPDLVINTSCEHFADYNWYYNLPKGQKFLLQSTNMLHPTHVLRPDSLEGLKIKLGDISSIFFQGKLPFVYPNFNFERYMIIGEK